MPVNEKTAAWLHRMQFSYFTRQDAGRCGQGGAVHCSFAYESHQRSLAVAAAYNISFEAISRTPCNTHSPFVSEQGS
jgi:hypothetical protein